MSEIYSPNRVKEVLQEWIDENPSLIYDELRVLLAKWKGSKLERSEKLLITHAYNQLSINLGVGTYLVPVTNSTFSGILSSSSNPLI